MGRWLLFLILGFIVSCSKIPFESNNSLFQSSTRQLAFAYPLETPSKDKNGNPSFPFQNIEEVADAYSDIYGVRFLELATSSRGPRFINPTNQGTSGYCLGDDCSQIQNLFSYHGYGPTVVYGVQVISSQSCPAEDDLLRWTNIGMLPEMQTLCVGYFKKSPSRDSHMPYLRDIYITKGGNHRVGASCRTGYQSIANFLDCLEGSCEGNQLLCVEYGSF